MNALTAALACGLPWRVWPCGCLTSANAVVPCAEHGDPADREREP